MTDFPGAHWWRFDFHAHTPISSDYRGDMAILPANWLLDYMRAGIDCVVVTDHNCGGWIGPLQDALKALSEQHPQHPDFRPLVVLPGVEITTAEEIHLLGVFAAADGAEPAVRVLARVDCPTAGPNAQHRCSKSAVDVIDAIHKEHGLAIAAHIDRKSGLYEAQANQASDGTVKYKTRLRSRNIAAILDKLDAVEVFNESSPAIADFLPALRKRLALVASSDAHSPRDIVGSSAWVKMPSPGVEGLRLAFYDARGAVERYDASEPSPNRTPKLWLRGLEAGNLRLRRAAVGPLSLRFNPWFNAIIGGRGTGKSSLVELIRLALRRDSEFDRVNEGPLQQIADTFRNFAQANGKRGGALLPETTVAVELRDDDAEERVRWEHGTGLTSVDEKGARGWQAVPEAITDEFVRTRFPVTILSQKQIFALAEQRGYLLSLIDREPSVDRAEWQRRCEQARQRFFTLRAQARQLAPDLKNRPTVEAELRDVKRKLSALELSHHKDSLKLYQQAQAQLSSQRNLIAQWERDLDVVVKATEDENLFGRVDFHGFDAQVAEEAEFLSTVDQVEADLRSDYLQIRQAVARLQEKVARLPERFGALALRQRIAAAEQTYRDLLAQLKAQGVESPDQYGLLVARHQELEKHLKRLDDQQVEQGKIKQQAKQASDDLAELRREISRKRQEFIQDINKRSEDRVRLKLVPYGGPEGSEAEFRQLLKQPDAFVPDIFERQDGYEDRGVLARLFEKDVGDDGTRPDFEEDLRQLKKDIVAMRREPGRHTDLLGDKVHGKLQMHIEARLSDREIDDLLAWYPEDGLDLSFRQQDGNGAPSWLRVDHASAGQKSAAVLSLLLAFGEQPLIVDQPEDDLDNAMVMDLVVEQIRRNKTRRQLIVVTHNANVVVNGDAEYVIPMVFRGGSIEVDAEGLGSVAERGTRKAICAVMEGGEKALRLRYKKVLEDLS